MTTHDKLVHVLTQEDMRLNKQERVSNPHRIAHYLRALEHAESTNDLLTGILDAFTHCRMRDKLLRAAGYEPCKCPGQGTCRMCS